jgi:hypothetical protein
MKKLVFSLMFTLLLPINSYAAILWTETFDWLTSDWELGNDQDGGALCPGRVYSGQSWPNCDADTSGGPGTSCVTDCVRGDSETPDIQISTTASRTGASGDRGFRVIVNPTSCGTCDENGITDSSLWTGQTNFYLRWYMRLNFTTQTNYKKIFRLKDSGNYQRFILGLHSDGHIHLSSSADSFNNSTYNGNWDFRTDYTINTWILVEVYIDQTNDQWTLWIDEVQQGSPVSFPASNYTITGTMIGGNQCGTAGYTHYVDYDDLAVGTTYIGPAEGESDTTAPTVSITTSDPSSTTSKSFTINGTSSDAVGVTEVA